MMNSQNPSAPTTADYIAFANIPYDITTDGVHEWPKETLGWTLSENNVIDFDQELIAAEYERTITVQNVDPRTGEITKNEINQVMFTFRGAKDPRESQTEGAKTFAIGGAWALAGYDAGIKAAALTFFNNAIKSSPGAQIFVTGMSLGGALSQLIADGDPSVSGQTFGAFGILPDGQKSNNNKLINWVDVRDPVAMTNVNGHVGDTYYLGVGTQYAKYLQSITGKRGQNTYSAHATAARLDVLVTHSVPYSLFPVRV